MLGRPTKIMSESLVLRHNSEKTRELVFLIEWVSYQGARDPVW